jgi:hypothetical protein
MGRMIQFLVCVLAAGCVTAKVHRLDQDVRPARTPDAIETLAEAPDRPYAVIARIESKSDAVFDSFDDLRTRMIAEAAELGGDALVLGPESTESDFVILPTGFLVKSDRKKLAGEVIVFD